MKSMSCKLYMHNNARCRRCCWDAGKALLALLSELGIDETYRLHYGTTCRYGPSDTTGYVKVQRLDMRLIPTRSNPCAGRWTE